MSINEIIKKHLPIENQKLSKLTTKINHCQAKTYKYCSECHENKFQICNSKLIFQAVEQFSKVRWHLNFKCENNHLVIRWVIIDNKDIIVGTVKH